METNIHDTIRTLIRGIVGAVIVLGILYIAFLSAHKSDYELCIDNCPRISFWNPSFANQECPKMCVEVKCSLVNGEQK